MQRAHIDEMTAIQPGGAAREMMTLEEAFPVVDPLMAPLGNSVIVQMRRVKSKTKGGIILAGESKDWDASMIRVGKVIAIGPLAYKKREDLTPWPEGAWVKVGDYVRVPVHAGVDGWKVWIAPEEWIQFSSFNDYDIKNKISGNPLDVIDYV